MCVCVLRCEFLRVVEGCSLLNNHPLSHCVSAVHSRGFGTIRYSWPASTHLRVELLCHGSNLLDSVVREHKLDALGTQQHLCVSVSVF